LTFHLALFIGSQVKPFPRSHPRSLAQSKRIGERGWRRGRASIPLVNLSDVSQAALAQHWPLRSPSRTTEAARHISSTRTRLLTICALQPRFSVCEDDLLDLIKRLRLKPPRALRPHCSSATRRPTMRFPRYSSAMVTLRTGKAQRGVAQGGLPSSP
jgi:hypothetical protein